MLAQKRKHARTPMSAEVESANHTRVPGDLFQFFIPVRGGESDATGRSRFDTISGAKYTGSQAEHELVQTGIECIELGLHGLQRRSEIILRRYCRGEQNYCLYRIGFQQCQCIKGDRRTSAFGHDLDLLLLSP